MMMTPSPTELTTSATDAVLALECILIAAYLRHTGTVDRWRAGLWCWILGLIAFSAFLGAVAHGFEMPGSMYAALWKPLYLSLGILIGLFLVGAVYDWRGRIAAGRLVPWSIGGGVAFLGVTEIVRGPFIVFAVYEAAVMLSVLAIYVFLAATHRLKGAGVVSVAIVLNLAAAGAQASDLSVRIWVPFDHNGIFHLVQMAGAGMLGLGLRFGMQPDARGVFRESSSRHA